MVLVFVLSYDLQVRLGTVTQSRLVIVRYELYGIINGIKIGKVSLETDRERDTEIGWGHLPSEAKASKPSINKFKN